jgi:hypothetical protein
MKPISFSKWIREDFGKVLFAPDRKDVPKPAEPNTKDEQQAWEAFKKHYIGGKDGDLVRALPDILAAKRKGLYREFLEVPSTYKYAYRLMSDMTSELMSTAAGVVPDLSVSKGQKRGGVYKPKPSSPVSSWTVEPAVVSRLLQDFGSLYRRNQNSYHILLVAQIAQNRDGFIINPDKYDDVPAMAGQFSYQREIISVKPIKLERVIYCDKDEFNKNDKQIIDWLLGQI